MMEDKCNLGKFQIAIGSTTCSDQTFLAEDIQPRDDMVCDEFSQIEELDEPTLLNMLHSESNTGEFDLDDIMVSAVQEGPCKGVDKAHLAKIWRINEDTAQKTIDITTQRSVRSDNPKLSRNYGTNDRMMRYKHLNEYFYMDTLFATSKSKKTIRGNTCAQLFVIEKGFVYVVPMTKEADMLLAIKQFAKAVGARDALICDATKAQKSKAVKRFCLDIGTALKVLEENTP
jgi:hypothetical protein